MFKTNEIKKNFVFFVFDPEEKAEKHVIVSAPTEESARLLIPEHYHVFSCDALEGDVKDWTETETKI